MKIPLSYSFKNIFVRKVATGLAVLGIALVVVVFISILALANGFKKTIATSGENQNLLILRKGAQNEMSSDIPREIMDIAKGWPEVAKDAENNPLVSPEKIVVVVLPKADGKPTNVLVRGVSPKAFDVHTKVKVSSENQSRPLQWGRQEILIGRALSKRLKQIQVGSQLSLGKLREFTIVGTFDAEETAFESEIWMDEVLFSDTFSRDSYQSLVIRLKNEEDFNTLARRIAVEGVDPVEPDPRLKIYEANWEKEYYRKQSELMSTLIIILGWMISIIMSAGAISGAMNTMYSSIRYRRREIGTLLALGFTPLQVWISFILESMFLAFLGGLVGCLFALPVNGVQTGTTNWTTFSESTFTFQISSSILGYALIFSLFMGFVGGFFPALSAARLRVIQALRRE